MIQLDRLERRFGKTTLFTGLSWRILAHDRVGLVGPNGAGKTTVLRLLAGIDHPDEGAIHKGAAVQVAYLPQEVETIVNGSVLDVALSGMEEVGELEARLQELEHELASMPQDDPELDELTERYGELRHRFEDLDGDRAESRARAVLSGLGVPTARFHEPLEQLSGGWRMRVALARLLLGEPDLLLLDEPTNHLDLEALGWLEQFLADRSGAYVIVSHDRYFLNRLADGIVEIADGKLTQWSGNYDAYIEGRALRDEQLEKQAKAQERKRAETERFVERFRYKATKARQVQSRIKQLAKQDSVEQIAAQGTVRFGFPPAPRSGDVVASLKEVGKSFDGHLVYRSADLLVRRGDRLAVVGPNGSGKSTLLRMLSGRLHPDSGEVKLGHNVQFHYYAQHQLDELDGSLTVLEEMRRSAPEQTPGKLRSLLGCFLFQGEAVEKRVAVLSGGEKARLALAKMLVHPANLLLLDEPTNHLDLASREVLEDALNEFDGTIVLVSHDRYFMNRVVSGLVEADEAVLRRHEGDYDSFYARKREAAEATVQEAQEQSGADSPGRRRELKRHEAEERNRNYRVEQKRQKQLQPIEDEIAAIEKRIESLTADQARPEVYSDSEKSKLVAQELKVAQQRLGQAYEEWERLERSL